MKTDWQVIGLLLIVLATVSAIPDLEWRPLLIVVAAMGLVFMLVGALNQGGEKE